MKKRVPFVSIVVANYNGRKFLKRCFDALFKLNYPTRRIEILMVDNCSLDDSVSFVKKNFPKVKIFKNDVNNYARANNLGVKKAKGDFIAFVNNDIQVDKNWLLELINIMDTEKRAGITGGKILLKDGRINSTGHEEYPDFYFGDRGFNYEDKGQYEHVEEALSLCGAAVLFRKTCLTQIGAFDEDFIMYLEDVDMCLRCAKKKWKVIYVPKCIARHYFRGTSSDESVRYFSERNRLLLIAKHFPTQLGKALFGKGYFTAGDNSIFDIFPLILRKLSESQGIDAFKNNLPAIFKNLKNIAVLEKNVLMDRTREFKRTVIQKEASLAELSRANAQLHEQSQRAARDIELKDTLLREKEASLAELSRANAQLHEQSQRAARDIELKDTLLREKEASLAELSRANAQLHEQSQRAARDIELKDTLLREKEASLAELSRANAQLHEQSQRAARDIELKDTLLREKEASLAELSRANAQLHEQSQRAARDIELKDTLLREKEASLAELSRANAQLHEQSQRAARDIELKDTLLREKEASLAELSRANAQLHEQSQRAARDIELKDTLLREKEASLAELSRANAQLHEQLKKALHDIESRSSLLLEKETLLNQKEIQLHKIKEELMISSNDLEKTVRFDQKIKILLVKSPEVVIKDARDAIRIIKNKYPNSTVYLFATLLKQDHEKLMSQVETSLLHYQDEPKSSIENIKLYARLFLTKFNLAVTLTSHKQAGSNAGHKKARLITILSNSKNQCVYYVD